MMVENVMIHNSRPALQQLLFTYLIARLDLLYCERFYKCVRWVERQKCIPTSYQEHTVILPD